MMKTQKLQENLAAGLAHRGLPLEYADRTASELADHHRDLVEELTNVGMDEQRAQAEASNRLGDQKTLIKKSVREYQRRHWCGRWPLLTFLIGPVVLLAASWVATGLLLFGLGILLESLGLISAESATPAVEYIAGLLFKAWFVFLMPAVIVYYFARRASRAAMALRWTVLAASVLAVVVGTMPFRFTQMTPMSDTVVETETGEPIATYQLVFGIPIASLFMVSSMYADDFSLVCQLLLPWIVAGIFLWRTHQLTLRNQRHQFTGT